MTDDYETNIERKHLATLADYCRDEIVMHDVQDPDLRDAVVAAYDALGHEDDLVDGD